MGRIKDIRIVKKKLREKYRNLRIELDENDKVLYDRQIFELLTCFNEYKNTSTLLCFISTEIEVETSQLIKHSLEIGKTVAVPKCTNLCGGMAFYIINSYADLEISTFGLLEPKIASCKLLTNFESSICIVPGFAFDKSGYRIGFGKGYYDRFLNSYNGIKLGVCYESCVVEMLPRGRYDVAADYIVTQNAIIKT